MPPQPSTYSPASLVGLLQPSQGRWRTICEARGRGGCSVGGSAFRARDVQEARDVPALRVQYVGEGQERHGVASGRSGFEARAADTLKATRADSHSSGVPDRLPRPPRRQARSARRADQFPNDVTIGLRTADCGCGLRRPGCRHAWAFRLSVALGMTEPLPDWCVTFHEPSQESGTRSSGGSEGIFHNRGLGDNAASAPRHGAMARAAPGERGGSGCGAVHLRPMLPSVRRQRSRGLACSRASGRRLSGQFW